jgi:VIT1/CCC1 family predicted Fe2+/Mn2+ transporter
MDPGGEPTTEQVDAAAHGEATHPHEPHAPGRASKLNWLLAGMLGANDRIVSVAGIVVGVPAQTARSPSKLHGTS